jgi:uncharacterized protein (TIGR00369 family)
MNQGLTAGGRARGVFENAPIVQDLGVHLRRAGEGSCEATLDVTVRHLQQDALVHSGVLATLADLCASGAAQTLAPPASRVVTSSMDLHFLRPARGARLLCRAQVFRPGRSLSMVEADVHCQESEKWIHVARATVTVAILNA